MSKDYIQELKRFIKKYYKIVLSSGLVLGLVFFGAFYILTGKSDSEPNDSDEEVTATEGYFENNSTPAYFQFYVENLDGSIFANYETIQRFLTKESVYQDIRHTLGVDLKTFQKGLQDSGHDRYSPVKVTRDENTNIYTTIIELGNNDMNMMVANYYFDYIFSNEFDLLANNIVYEVLTPQFAEVIVDEEPLTDTTFISEEKEFNKDVIIGGILGFIAGILLSLTLIVLKELTSDKLNFIFTYMFNQTDKILIYSTVNNRNNEFLGRFIAVPYSKSKLVLSEKILSEEMMNLLVNNVKSEISTINTKSNDKMFIDFNQSVANTSVRNHYEEIILIVESTITSREWFEDQLKLISLDRKPTKVIQINQ